MGEVTQQQVDKGQAHVHLQEQQQAGDEVHQGGQRLDENLAALDGDVLPAGQADRADGAAQRVLDVDDQLAPGQAGVDQHRTEHQPRQDLRDLVIRRADVLAQHEVEAGPGGDQRQRRVGDRPHDAPQGEHGAAAIGSRPPACG